MPSEHDPEMTLEQAVELAGLEWETVAVDAGAVLRDLDRFDTRVLPPEIAKMVVSLSFLVGCLYDSLHASADTMHTAHARMRGVIAQLRTSEESFQLGYNTALRDIMATTAPEHFNEIQKVLFYLVFPENAEDEEVPFEGYSTETE